ncbi:hypothetical protein I4U23_002438 [Adineta vaga]|nr:hypothetical protein I4U23_002438 [Adineta vaga]
MLNNTMWITSLYIKTIISNEKFGEIMFIVIVILWYASSIVFLLKMQTDTTTDMFDNSTKRSTRLFVQSLRDQTNNTEVLKELVDKQKRDKLWDIYLGDSRDKVMRAESRRIRNIEKQLATVDPYRRDSVQRILDDSFIQDLDSDLGSVNTDSSSSNTRVRTRRRSSIDHQILEQWKLLANELKPHEYWPWAIQRLFIRRHLRRQRCATHSGSTT